MTRAFNRRPHAGFLLRAGLAAGAALTLALAAGGAAHASTVTDAKGDILPTFDAKGSKTTDNFADLDVVSAAVTFNSNDVFLTAQMAGAIGSTENGFYVWGVNTGTGTEFFQTLTPALGKGVAFDTFIILNPNGTGSVNYFSGEPSEGLGAGSVTINGNTISAVIPRDLLESTGFDISQYGFNIWPRTNGFANTDIADFAPDARNFEGTAVPEPATWAFLIAGFGLVGSAMRRRRNLQAA
jgi:hypothetical protein